MPRTRPEPRYGSRAVRRNEGLYFTVSSGASTTPDQQALVHTPPCCGRPPMSENPTWASRTTTGTGSHYQPDGCRG